MRWLAFVLLGVGTLALADEDAAEPGDSEHVVRFLAELGKSTKGKVARLRVSEWTEATSLHDDTSAVVRVTVEDAGVCRERAYSLDWSAADAPTEVSLMGEDCCDHRCKLERGEQGMERLALMCDERGDELLAMLPRRGAICHEIDFNSSESSEATTRVRTVDALCNSERRWRTYSCGPDGKGRGVVSCTTRFPQENHAFRWKPGAGHQLKLVHIETFFEN